MGSVGGLKRGLFQRDWVRSYCDLPCRLRSGSSPDVGLIPLFKGRRRGNRTNSPMCFDKGAETAQEALPGRFFALI